MSKSIWIGFDPREASAFAVARSTIRAHCTQPTPIYGVVLDQLRRAGLYKRPTKQFINREGFYQLIDVLSARDDYDGRMSTQHAIARFFVPHLAPPGWALFVDGDIMVRHNLTRIFDGLDSTKAAYCVKHNYTPKTATKMDGQLQTAYHRKNWSSVVIWNVGHPSNALLSIEDINTLPGRDLHAFCWLEDSEIGELDPKWNWLVGDSDPDIDPAIVHFTNGCPDMPGFENVPYADEWRAELSRWAAPWVGVAA